MKPVIARSLVALSLVVLPVSAAFAQAPAPAPGPSGHWEGTIELPNSPLPIEIDMAKDAAGALTGTFGQPAQNVRGLPLTSVKADGRTVTFVLKAGPDPSTFTGTLSEDGTTMTGSVEQAGRSLPFKVTRTGNAKVMTAPKSAPIAKAFEGTWDGVLEFNGRQMRLTLKMANQADGTSTGTIASQDGSGLEIAVGMTQKDKTIAVDVPAINGAFNGTLNTDGTELSGTWSQAGGSLPLVFKRAAR
jgi:hypothetical protein